MKSDKAGAVPGTTDSSMGGSKSPALQVPVNNMGYASSFDMGRKMTAGARHAGGSTPPIKENKNAAGGV